MELEKRDTTFFAEKYDSLIYSDNIIYNECKILEYEYYYQINNQKKKFKLDGFRKWSYANLTDTSSKFISKIRLSSYYPNGNYDNPPQSPIAYQYLDVNNNVVRTENTGVLENSKNIRIHIPRGRFFNNVFPFAWPSVTFPMEIDKSWY